MSTSVPCHQGNDAQEATSAEFSLVAEQPYLDGLGKKSHKSRVTPSVQRVPAQHLPVARVVVDNQAPQLGQLFDYLIEDKDSDIVQPGSLVRVRFGKTRYNAVVWERADYDSAAAYELKYIERVLSPEYVPQTLRDHIDAISEYAGGTRANILRLAVPPRVEKVDTQFAQMNRLKQDIAQSDGDDVEDFAKASAASSFVHESAISGRVQIEGLYDSVGQLCDAVQSSSLSALAIWDTLPGVERWSQDLAWLACQARVSGKQIVFVMPDMKHVQTLVEQCVKAGLKEFGSYAQRGLSAGDFVVVNSSLPSTERYSAYKVVASGFASVVIGTRSAMYAPVAKESVYVAWNSQVYQNWEGLTPYPNVRDVLRIRAAQSSGLVVYAGYARSAMVESYSTQSLQILDYASKDTAGMQCIELTPQASARATLSPWVRILNRAELEDKADPALGARIPHTAVIALRQALERGPVLLSIPHKASASIVCCASCKRAAQCRRCLGPLRGPAKTRNAVPVCAWCATVALGWSCRHCDHAATVVLRTGVEDTARELTGLFPGVPLVVSSTHQARGVVAEIDDKPRVVIATVGDEPRVVPAKRPNTYTDEAQDTPELLGYQGYQSVGIVDAWISLYGTNLDSRTDTLNAWMSVAAQCVSRDEGGQVLVMGEIDNHIAGALTSWNNRLLSEKEVAYAREMALPPAVSAAVVWGEKDSVQMLLSDAVSEYGGFDDVASSLGSLPAVLGPVDIAQPSSVSQRQFDEMYQRARCVIRVPHERVRDLAHSLHYALAKHAASGKDSELHFQINPKNLS